MFTGHPISVQLREECKNVQRGNAEPSATHNSASFSPPWVLTKNCEIRLFLIIQDVTCNYIKISMQTQFCGFLLFFIFLFNPLQTRAVSYSMPHDQTVNRQIKIHSPDQDPKSNGARPLTRDFSKSTATVVNTLCCY